MEILIIEETKRKARVYLVFDGGGRVLLDRVSLGIVSLADLQDHCRSKFSAMSVFVVKLEDRPRRPSYRVTEKDGVMHLRGVKKNRGRENGEPISYTERDRNESIFDSMNEPKF